VREADVQRRQPASFSKEALQERGLLMRRAFAPFLPPSNLYPSPIYISVDDEAAGLSVHGTWGNTEIISVTANAVRTITNHSLCNSSTAEGLM
jgi:hypothetical protein